jgi:hypothetical protein
MGDQITYTLEGLAKASSCLGKLNEYINTPNFGQLPYKYWRFINGNDTWYSGSNARQALSEYNTYFRHGSGSNAQGKQKGLEENSGVALMILNRTIITIAQNDENVRTYFNNNPATQAQMPLGWQFATNFWDAALIDPYNGALAWADFFGAGGENGMTYASRMNPTMKTNCPPFISRIFGTTGYASGSVATQALLSYLPGGAVLSKAFASAQGSGVIISYGLSDDGVVTSSESTGATFGGALLGLALDFLSSGVTNLANQHLGSLFGGSTQFVSSAAGAEIEEAVGAGTTAK